MLGAVMGVAAAGPNGLRLCVPTRDLAYTEVVWVGLEDVWVREQGMISVAAAHAGILSVFLA